MAQGVAWMAREEGVPATIVAPDHAPQTKLDAIERLGGTVIKVPFDRWWQSMEEGSYPGVEGLFVHPVLDDAVMAGNGTIGLELVEDLDEIDTVLVPWGGGGLATGIASALAAVEPGDRRCSPASRRRAPRSRPRSPPASRSRSTTRPSFVDGAGRQDAAARDVGASPPAARAARSRSRSTRPRAAVRLLAERARVDRRRCRRPLGRRGALGPRRRRAASSASSRAATSTPAGSRRSSRAGRRPRSILGLGVARAVRAEAVVCSSSQRSYGSRAAARTRPARTRCPQRR